VRVLAGALAVVTSAVVLLPAASQATDAAAPTPRPSADPAPVTEDDPCAEVSEESPVVVEVSTLLPRAPTRPDEPFQVAGRLRNCGEQSLSALEVRLAVGLRLRTRGELQRADEEPVVGVRRAAVPAAQEELDPGESTPFDLRLLVGDLRMNSGLGVYPLAIQARARYGEDRRRTAVGLATTFVPWFPDGPPAPTRIAWLWPLLDQPRRGPNEVMLDDALDQLVAAGEEGAPGGRLHALLAAAREGARGACDPAPGPPAGVETSGDEPCRGEPVPMTYGIDPGLLYSLEAMTRPYSVASDGEPASRPPSTSAQQWLGTLRDEVARSDVLALPFGDPDVVAMWRAGPELRDDIEQLRKLGQAETRRVLGTEPLTSVAWPPPGPVTPALDVLVGGQARAAVLDVSALPPASAARSRTPNARTELPTAFGTVPGLVVEDVLSALVEAEPRPGQGARLAEQRFVAETAIIAAEVPSRSRTLLVAPRRTADVHPAVAAAAIADSGRLPWLCPVSLAQVAAGTERCATLPDDQGPAEAEERVGRGGDAEPPDDRDGELSQRFLERLARVTRASDQLTDAVLLAGTDAASGTTARLLRAHGRAASAAWRDQPLGGDRMLRLLQEEVAALRGQVRLVSEPVLLTGSSGVLQLVVQNELDQPVTVGVRLDKTSSARLSSSATDVQVIPARNATQVPIRVEPRTSGRFVVLATLVDAEGRPFGDPVQLDVRSTQYGRVALAVTGVAAAVLLVAAGLRITRRALRRTPDEAG
jgi:hypothetical protein